MAPDAPFPDKRWGTEHSPLRSVIARFAATGIGSWTVRTLAPLDRRLMTRSKGKYTTVGSNFGQSGHPGWTTNLLADPTAWVNIDGTEIEATAALVVGPEKTRIYDEFEKMVDAYRVYKGRTSRDMRIFRLSAV